MQAKTQMLTPPLPLKYAGKKTYLLETLSGLYKPFRKDHVFVEPFLGSGAVSLSLQPDQAILNDSSDPLIEFHKWSQQGLEYPYEELASANNKDDYYRLREEFNHLISNKETLASQRTAQLLLYLNRHCYNGLYRFNAGREFNTPFGKYKRVNVPDPQAIKPYYNKKWSFFSKDFEDLEVPEKAFIYCDPPYLGGFHQYTPEGFDFDDHKRLIVWIANQRCPVVYSNSFDQKLSDLLNAAGFKVKLVQGPRAISCDGDRRPALEILATKHV
jgi:DNA adenine methylase